MTKKPASGRRAAMIAAIVMTLMMQHPANPATAQSIHPNLTRYTELDGLPAPEVYSIMQDQFGYIWTGSINGLTRFDGYEFIRFYSNPNDPGSIRGLQIQSIYEDSRGQIWVASSPENVNVYDPQTESFRHYTYKHLI
ncbi:MAG: two-component regulator propeller domain-containing protein, partial [Cyclonatronaceae bacterium]